MEWFNVFGLIFMVLILIPNIIFAIKCKDGFDNKWNNKYVEVMEQVGRFGCFGFMIINIPGTWFGWWSDEAFALEMSRYVQSKNPLNMINIDKCT